MKTTIMLLLFSAATFCRAATQELFITDGNSLQDHIRVWHRANDGAKKRSDDSLMAAFTVQYITGFIEGASIWQAYDREGCPYAMPTGMQSRQFIEIAGKYLAEHPEELHRTAADILEHAAVAAFPNPEFKPHNASREDHSHP